MIIIIVIYSHKCLIVLSRITFLSFVTTLQDLQAVIIQSISFP